MQVKGFEQDDTEEPFSARNTYLGLKGQFGELVVEEMILALNTLKAKLITLMKPKVT